jgi:hypothetical protein
VVHTRASIEADPQLNVSFLWDGVVSPELEQIRREVERVAGAMSRDDWRYAPPGKWSCAQILEHLLLSYTATTKGTQTAIQTGKPLGGQPRLRDRLATFYVARLGFLPSGRTAPKQTTPRNGVGAESLRQFNDALVAMDATLADAEKRFGSACKILDHPILGPLNTKDWRRVHRTHAKHHLKQIEKRLRQASSGRA